MIASRTAPGPCWPSPIAAALKALRERIGAKTNKLIDRLFGAGMFDAISGLAETYPLRVFPDAIGISPIKPGTLLPYGHGDFNSLGPCKALFQISMRDVADVRV